jgi:hypothetical protein
MNVPNLPPSYGSINSLSDLMHAMNLYKSELQAGVVDVKGSAKFVRERLTKIKELKDFSKEANQYVELARKNNSAIEYMKRALFGQWEGKLGAFANSAVNVSGLVGFAGAILATIDVKVQEFIQDEEIKATDKERESVSRGFTLFINKQLANNARFARLESNLAKEKILRDKTAADAAYVLKETPKIRELAQAANKKANDSLYETRTNTAKFKTQIANIEKFNNNITYEVREGRKKLQTEINDNRNETQKAINLIQSDTQKSLDSIVGSFDKSILAINKNVDINDKNTAIVDKKLNRFTGVDFPKYVDTELNRALLPTNNSIAGIKLDVKKALDAGTKADFKSDTNQKEIKEIQIKLSTGLPEVKVIQRDIVDNIKPAIFREGETRKIWEAKQSEELKIQYTSIFGQQDRAMKELQAKFDTIVGDNRRLLDRTTKLEFTSVTDTPTRLQQLRIDVDKIKTDVDTGKKMDEVANKKLDEIKPLVAGIPTIIAALAFVPKNVGNELVNRLPNIKQIEDAAATGTCKTFQPGGCSTKGLKDLGDSLNDAANTRGKGLLDAINTGANSVQLGILNTINAKMGEAIPGGLSGKLVSGFKWLQLDRALSVLTFAATIQNHLMLSRDVGQTLLGAFSNVLSLIGLKDDSGQPYDLGTIISSSLENLVKGIVGEENYSALSETWAKANRIYQASTNVLNSFQNISSTILTGIELVGSYTGKIGNALKKSGEVLDSAYGWMNPQPKFNRVSQFLENLQQGASTIQQVTQVPVDVVNAVTELQTANTELIKAIKEDGKPENKAQAIPEPDNLKAEELASKIASRISNILPDDLFNAAD